MPDPDEAVSAVILLGNCRSIARLVRVSADREQEEMQKATYLRAAVLSPLYWRIHCRIWILVHCALYTVHVARL
jgi:hypothetical protein